ncbi:hypothetical protein EJB05_31319, partial [Eragrostis curvula]
MISLDAVSKAVVVPHSSSSPSPLFDLEHDESTSPMMKEVLESPLLGEFIAYLKANWTGRSRVDQRRRRLRQLIIKVRAVTDAAESRGCRGRDPVRDGSFVAWLHMLREEALRGQQVLDAASCDAAAVASSTRRFLSGLRGLVVCNAEVDRLTEAVEELERLAGPGGDLDQFLRLLQLDSDNARATAMEVDGRPDSAPPRRQEASGGSSSSSADSVDSAGAAPPVPGGKRKRACGSGVDGGASSSSHGQGGSVVEQRKRRVLGWAWPHHWPLPTFGGLFAATRAPQPPAPRPRCARSVALAMARVRRRIGKPTGQRRRQSLDQRLSRLSL